MGDFAILDEVDNIIHLQLKIDNVISDDFFSKFENLKFLSLDIIGDKPVLINLENNIELKEVFLNRGVISKMILPVKSKVELIGTFRGEIENVVNLKEQNALKILRINNDANNLDHLNDNNSLEMLTLFSRSDDKKINMNLSKIKSIKYLYLPGDEHFEISSLYNLNKLRYLILGDGVSIKDIELPNTLEVLRFGGSVNDKMPNLSELVNIREVYVYNTKINYISGLDYAANIEVLFFVGNPIINMDGLDSLLNLKELKVDGGEIEKITNLTNLKKLEVLDLPYNKISVIDELNLPDSVKSLRLYGNDIERIDLLQLKNLPDNSVMIDTDPVFENNTPTLRRKLL